MPKAELVTAKMALDALFEGIKFDQKLMKALVRNNVSFMTRNEDYKSLFGTRLVGCHTLSYTHYDKSIFYQNVGDLAYDKVLAAIGSITTIPEHFKIARDDVNVVCFYLAHRFLTSTSLSPKQRVDAALEALNYFNYRTLVHLCGDYFVYPISEDKAQTLTECLSNKFMIKRLKNWAEYGRYRSEQFLDKKYRALLESFNDDEDLAQGISDLHNRTKRAILAIYDEFTRMIESGEVIKSRGNIITDMDGQDKVIDKVDSVVKYLDRVAPLLSDRNALIRRPVVTTTTGIIDSVSPMHLEEFLGYVYEYAGSGRVEYTETLELFKDIVINVVDYLHSKQVYLNSHVSAVKVIDYIVGNVLYARGTDVEVSALKERIHDYAKKVYKKHKQKRSDRALANIRNALYIYITIAVVVNS